MFSGLSDTPGDFLGWRGCIGNVPARENLQVYSLVIFIIVFFPKTCSKKIEGWISWNGGYMDKTRWEVANNIANHPPKWGYHQVLPLTFSRLRGVFSAKKVGKHGNLQRPRCEPISPNHPENLEKLPFCPRNFEGICIFMFFLNKWFLKSPKGWDWTDGHESSIIKCQILPGHLRWWSWFGGPRISECSGMPLVQPGRGGIWFSTPKRGKIVRSLEMHLFL